MYTWDNLIAETKNLCNNYYQVLADDGMNDGDEMMAAIKDRIAEDLYDDIYYTEDEIRDMADACEELSADEKDAIITLLPAQEVMDREELDIVRETIIAEMSYIIDTVL